VVDAVEVERRGKPTVTIVHDAFERAARLHARALGMPDLPLLVEPAPRGGTINFEVKELARRKLADLLSALTAGPRPAEVGPDGPSA
jgi:hypothetical protein